MVFLLVLNFFLSDDEALSIGLTNKEKSIQTYMKYIGDSWYMTDFMKDSKGVCSPINFCLQPFFE